ncbi:dTDP-4-dehydrorhamnose 3,5-epimerase [Ramlibacter sp.]|uniref:dTDP-4-dehydrorhamnose 3,5-epimerase n=1 Tax=Ramlibacter sp. TaxID=1917967 RepID=UPI003D0FC48A
MSRFAITDTPLASLKVIERRRLQDDRGFLSRLFCGEELGAAGWHAPIAQINHTLTRRRGALRGMHFQQAPHAEMKLVNCIRGEVFDVAVDLRAGSPTFLRWHAERLSPDNGRAMLIPEGFAHGFQALTDDCELVYLHSHAYVPSSEGGVNAQEPRIGIEWPLPVTDQSDRDRGFALLSAAYPGLTA